MITNASLDKIPSNYFVVSKGAIKPEPKCLNPLLKLLTPGNLLALQWVLGIMSTGYFCSQIKCSH